MATNGTLNTNSYDGRYYQLSWTATQSIEKNQSTVTWTLKALGKEGFWYAERTLKLTIAGTTVYTKTARVERYTGVIATGTKIITHNSNGAANFSVRIEAAVYGSSINCTGSAEFTLTTIARKSTLSVNNGTLGVELTLTVTRQSTAYTHMITYMSKPNTDEIADAGVICNSNTTQTSITWTPPLELARQNTTGTKVSVCFTIRTYHNGTEIGATDIWRTMTIPESVKPSCTVSVTDPTGYADKYGAYIKLMSKFKVVVTTTQAYDSAIKTYKTTANGNAYTEASFESDALKMYGELNISTTVTDGRGRSGSASTKKTVWNYEKPAISKLSVKRCDAAGAENDQGEYVKVTFSGKVTSLNAKNTAEYVLRYKKTSESNYTSVNLGNYKNEFEVTDGTHIFLADSGSSYDVALYLTDDFGTFIRATSASTGFTLMHWTTSGHGMAIGKIAELDGVFDLGLQTRFSGGILQPVIAEGTDLNNVLLPNVYSGKNAASAGYLNCPTTEGEFTLEVKGTETMLIQILTQCLEQIPRRYERKYCDREWGGWINSTGDWIELELSDGVSAVAEEISTPSYRKMGNRVFVAGGVKIDDFTEAGITIATLPEGYRPKAIQHCFGVVTGAGIARMYVNTSGRIVIEAIRDYISNSQVTGMINWLSIKTDFFID